MRIGRASLAFITANRLVATAPAVLFGLLACGIRPVHAQAAIDFSDSTKEGIDVNGDPADPGDLLDWTIVLRNAGPADATNVLVYDRIEGNQDFVSAGQGGSYDPATRTWFPLGDRLV